MRKATGQGRKRSLNRSASEIQNLDRRMGRQSALPGAVRIIYRGVEEFGVLLHPVMHGNRDEGSGIATWILALIG